MSNLSDNLIFKSVYNGWFRSCADWTVWHGYWFDQVDLLLINHFSSIGCVSGMPGSGCSRWAVHSFQEPRGGVIGRWPYLSGAVGGILLIHWPVLQGPSHLTDALPLVSKLKTCTLILVTKWLFSRLELLSKFDSPNVKFSIVCRVQVYVQNFVFYWFCAPESHIRMTSD